MCEHVDAVSPNSPSNAAQSGAAPEQAQEDEEEDNDEAIIPRAVPEVKQPTQQERDEHELLHMPFRSWCPHCVAGKSVERVFLQLMVQGASHASAPTTF